MAAPPAQPFVIGYRNFAGDGARPYLVMDMTGPNGKMGKVWGLVDSGADITSLPYGFASLMGYTVADLQPRMGTQAGGNLVCHLALKPCHAVVLEIPDLVIEMHPVFVEGSQAPLWGRGDFMRHFGVTIMELQQSFVITRLV
jgi:hypothetical protein